MRVGDRIRGAWTYAALAWFAGCGAASGSGSAGEGLWADEGAPFVFGWLRASDLEPDGRIPSPAEICPEELSRAVCRMRVQTTVPCSGASWTPEELAARTHWICICDLCAADADCTERSGGRCALLPGNTCEESLRICQYPGDTCHDPGACSGGIPRCMHGGGRAVCGEPDPPPP